MHGQDTITHTTGKSPPSILSVACANTRQIQSTLQYSWPQEYSRAAMFNGCGTSYSPMWLVCPIAPLSMQ